MQDDVPVPQVDGALIEEDQFMPLMKRTAFEIGLACPWDFPDFSLGAGNGLH
jgi:hypothetical protein